MKKLAWQPGETAPKDGQLIWAYLYQSGIRAIQWMEPEEHAEELGGVPDDYVGCFVEVDDHSEQWEPKWWLPYDAIPEPA